MVVNGRVWWEEASQSLPLGELLPILESHEHFSCLGIFSRCVQLSPLASSSNIDQVAVAAVLFCECIMCTLLGGKAKY